MKKPTVLALAAVVVVVLGGAAFWHHSGHPGLEHNHGQAAPSQGDHEHDHSSHGNGPTKLELNDGKKWATDQALRDGMGRMHQAVIPVYSQYKGKTLRDDEAKALAATIRTEVDGLVKNCKLEPKADAMLHIVIADLLTGAQVISGNPMDDNGIPKIVGALHAYAQHFDHPDF
ncbi:MAG: hypothetical protein R3E66_06890 [bacterium]